MLFILIFYDTWILPIETDIPLCILMKRSVNHNKSKTAEIVCISGYSKSKYLNTGTYKKTVYTM